MKQDDWGNSEQGVNSVEKKGTEQNTGNLTI